MRPFSADPTPTDLGGNGDLFWDLRTRTGNLAATGLNIWVLTSPEAPDRVSRGKFVIMQ